MRETSWVRSSIGGWVAVVIFSLLVFFGAVETALKFVWASHLKSNGAPAKGRVIGSAKTGAERTGLREVILGERLVQVSWLEGKKMHESTMHVQRHVNDGDEVALLVDPADRSKAGVVDRLDPAWQFAGLSTLLGTIFVMGLIRSARGTRQNLTRDNALSAEPT